MIHNKTEPVWFCFLIKLLITGPWLMVGHRKTYLDVLPRMALQTHSRSYHSRLQAEFYFPFLIKFLLSLANPMSTKWYPNDVIFAFLLALWVQASFHIQYSQPDVSLYKLPGPCICWFPQGNFKAKLYAFTF